MKCIVCNSIIEENQANKYSNLYYRCKLCGLVQQNLSNATTKDYDNFSYTVGFSRESYIRKRAQKILYELFNINKNIRSLIDIGSGAGFMLDEFRKDINIVVGVEPSKKLANYATKNFDLKIMNEYFTNNTLKKLNRKFDVVILSHIVEHLRNPVEFFNLVKNLLTHNGIIYVETPNILSWLSKIEGKNYTFLTPEDHICLYSKKSFNKFIKNKKTNLKSVRSYTYSDIEHIIGILSKLKRRIFLKRNNHKQANLKSTIRTINNNITNKNYFFENRILFSLLKFVIMPLMNLWAKGSYLVYYLKIAG